MPSLEITTVVGCSNGCLCCPQIKLLHAYKHNKSVLSYSDFEKIIKKVPRDVRIDFSGMAEPFLNRRAADMMLLAHACGYNLMLYTTLVGATQEDYDKIRLIPFEYIVIHSTDQYFEYDGWDDIYNNFREQNIPHIIGHKDIHSRAGNLPANIKSNDKYLKGKIKCSVCGYDYNRNVLLPNGEVYLCCFDYGLKHKLGNLLQDSYENLENAKMYLRQASVVSDSDLLCRRCEMSELA